LLVPLGVVLIALTQLPATSLASPFNLTLANSVASISSKRPAASNPAPPPTLAPPTATPKPSQTPVPATPAATSHLGGTYVVQAGDELKAIAADHQISIWKIIDANHIPDPDSLQIGQELQIPPA
jgi:LysM repeat protein